MRDMEQKLAQKACSFTGPREITVFVANIQSFRRFLDPLLEGKTQVERAPERVTWKTETGDIQRLDIFNTNVQTLRGIGGTEFLVPSYMDSVLFDKTIAVALARTNTNLHLFVLKEVVSESISRVMKQLQFDDE
jgi:hypothetical protein